MKKRFKKSFFFKKGDIVVPNILVESFGDWEALPTLMVQKVTPKTYELLNINGETIEFPKSYAHRVYLPIDDLIGHLLVERLQSIDLHDLTLVRFYDEAISIVRDKKEQWKQAG